nr:MAG TPA: Radical SAM superfamily [Caudoviricetes sp.]
MEQTNAASSQSAKQGCDMNCSTCRMENHIYCALQTSLNNQKILAEQNKKLDAIIQTLVNMLSPQTLIQPNITNEAPKPGGVDNVPESKTT